MKDKCEMGFSQAVKTCFAKYAVFSGRAARSEYWYWFLFTLLSMLVTTPLDIFFLNADINDMSTQHISNIFALITFPPSLSVGIRRLHDIEKSGWWLLIMFTGVGLLLLLYWACKEGTLGDNQFGQNPKINQVKEAV